MSGEGRGGAVWGRSVVGGPDFGNSLIPALNLPVPGSLKDLKKLRNIIWGEQTSFSRSHDPSSQAVCAQRQAMLSSLTSSSSTNV